MQSIPGLIEPEIFGFNLEVLNISDLDKYMSMVLESYLLKFDEVLQNDKNCYALNYHHGAMQMIDTIISKTKSILPEMKGMLWSIEYFTMPNIPIQFLAKSLLKS